MGWSMVCDSCISWLYSIVFILKESFLCKFFFSEYSVYASSLRLSCNKSTDNSLSCAYPESFVRGGGGSKFDIILVNEGERIQILLKVGHHRPASWHVDDGPTLNAGLVDL